MTALDYQSPVTLVEPNPLDWRELLKRLGPVVGLVFVFVVFSLLTPKTFLSTFNLRIMVVQTAVVGTAALGMTMVIIAGGIDLSVGSNVALCSVIIALLLKAGCSPVVAALGGIGMGVVVGLVIGGLITSLKLSPFIVTLGLMGALRGTAKGIASNTVVYTPAIVKTTWIAKLLRLDVHQAWINLPTGMWIFIFSTMTFMVAAAWIFTPRLLSIYIPVSLVITAVLTWGVIPPGVWLMVLLALVVAVLLQYTKLGRHIFAIGSNEQTARLCGVNVWRTKLMVYSMAAGLAGVAAILHFSFLNSMGDPTSAFGLELDVIAAVVIGGASLTGGEGTVLGSLAGALMMTAVANGCAAMQYENWVQEIVTGLIIVIAATLDRLRHRRTT